MVTKPPAKTPDRNQNDRLNMTSGYRSMPALPLENTVDLDHPIRDLFLVPQMPGFEQRFGRHFVREVLLSDDGVGIVVRVQIAVAVAKGSGS